MYPGEDRPVKKIVVALLATLSLAHGGDRTVVDAFAYAGDAALRAAWKPGPGAPAPSMARGASGGTTGAFRLPFAQRPERVFWDRAIAVNTAATGSFEVDLEIDDPETVSRLTIYLRSDPGWYAAQVSVPHGRRTVRIKRSDFEADRWGPLPGPWSRISTLRLSPWRAAARDAVLHIHSIAAIAADVTIVFPASVIAAQPGEKDTLTATCRDMARAFAEADIECGSLDDTDLSDEALSGAALLVFPCNAGLPDRAAEPLTRFTARGGKLLAFYHAPAPLAALIGVRAASWRRGADGEFHTIAFVSSPLVGLPATLTQNSWNATLFVPNREDARILGFWRSRDGRDSQTPAVVASSVGAAVGHVLLCRVFEERTPFLQAMAGALVPDLWRRAAAAALAAAASIEGVGDVSGLRAFLDNRRVPSAAWSAFRQGENLLDHAGKAYHFSAVPPLAAAARAKFVEAMAYGFRPRAGEMRAAWCHRPYGIRGMTWEESAARLAQAGFNMVIPNMLWAGVADYPSKVLPVRDGALADGDPLAACLAAAERHGLAVHVWKVNWNLSGAPAALRAALTAEGRLQVDAAGKTIAWLCPSHEKNFALERDAMLEVVRAYPVAGIHFDYIRYPDGRSCYCATCRATFEDRIGKKLARWPDDVLTGPLRASYLQYRRDTITRLVRSVAVNARAVRKDVKISAAVFPEWESCRDDLGQDWKYWIEEGLLDFVCPMNYTPSRIQFAAQVKRQLDWAGGRIPVLPGIGLSVHTREIGPDLLLWMIDDARRAGAGGFTLFEFDRHVLDTHLPVLARGATARP